MDDDGRHVILIFSRPQAQNGGVLLCLLGVLHWKNGEARRPQDCSLVARDRNMTGGSCFTSLDGYSAVCVGRRRTCTKCKWRVHDMIQQVGRFEVHALQFGQQSMSLAAVMSKKLRLEMGASPTSQIIRDLAPETEKLRIPSCPPRVFCCRGWSEVRKREPQFSGIAFPCDKDQIFVS